jgi:hypothetical protein
MNQLIGALGVYLAAAALTLACTTNVENPTVNQTGRTGDQCIADCDAQKVMCVGKCTDDMCKASCEATHTSCASSCTPTDGG